MPHHAGIQQARLSGPVIAVKGSLRRASPALDRAHRTLLSSPNHPTRFSKEPYLVRQLAAEKIGKQPTIGGSGRVNPPGVNSELGFDRVNHLRYEPDIVNLVFIGVSAARLVVPS